MSQPPRAGDRAGHEAEGPVGPRPRQRSYEPTWWEERFPWILDVLCALDPEPLARWLAPLGRPFRTLIEALCAPLAAGIDRAAWAGAYVRRRSRRWVRSFFDALPLPAVVQDWLWLRPVRLEGTGSESAQALWRKRSRVVLSAALVLAVTMHAALFMLWPTMVSEDISSAGVALETIELTPTVEVPPAPARIPRPAAPVLATAEIPDDATIAPTTFQDNPIDVLPPPPEEAVVEASRPTVTPFTIFPRIQNAAEVRALLIAEYPPPLRDAGIGGEIVMWFYLDELGATRAMRIAKGSGHESLDAAALRVAERIRFSPALNGDERVSVWVQFPIEFKVRR